MVSKKRIRLALTNHNGSRQIWQIRRPKSMLQYNALYYDNGAISYILSLRKLLDIEKLILTEGQ